MKIDAHGRCPNCLIKPIVYRGADPQLFCHRCSRRYDPASGDQVANHSWKRGEDGGFVAASPDQEYATVKPSAATLRAAARIEAKGKLT